MDDHLIKEAFYLLQELRVRVNPSSIGVSDEWRKSERELLARIDKWIDEIAG